MTPRDNFSICPYSTLFYSKAEGYLINSNKNLILKPELSFKKTKKKKYNIFFIKYVNKL